MTERNQRFCIWAGFGFGPVFFVGFMLVARFIPPPAPGMTAHQVFHMFATHRTRIRIGLWIATASSPLLVFYVTALTHQIKRIAGPHSPLATAQAIAGTCIVLEFLFPFLVWQTAAYRIDRSAATVQVLNDLAWLPFVGIVGTAMVQMFCVAVAVLQDRSERPLVPRWAAYLNLWAALGVAAGSLDVFAHRGPFAWNGLLAWWLLLVAFFIWFATMAVLMHRASRRLEDDGMSETWVVTTIEQRPAPAAPAGV
jgi:hypothetical protein